MAEQKPSLLSSIKAHVPATWSRIRSGTPHTVGLKANSAEYLEVYNDFRSTLRRVEPKQIFRVENPYMFGLYELKKAEYLTKKPQTQELNLWHATSVANSKVIVKTNLDWRLATRIKFGKGVSFSPSAKYANDQCNRSTPAARVSIRCKVLVGRTTTGSETTEVPPKGRDTTTGNGTLVYVKYADYEFYPQYVVYYNSPPPAKQPMGLAWY